MITCYFGVPGCGKTTLLSKFAINELKKIKKNKSKYKDIATINFQVPGCSHIDFDDLKKYKFYDTLILIDEITMDADNRSFKLFSSDIRDFFILHRHFGLDIIYATQNYENVDKKIRDLTQDLWYMSKSVVPLISNFTSAKKIYREVNINEMNSELTLGYRFCNLLEAFFVSNYKLVFRPFYYYSFDSFDELSLKGRPILNLEDKRLLNAVEKRFLNLSSSKIKKCFLRCTPTDRAEEESTTSDYSDEYSEEDKKNFNDFWSVFSKNHY